MARPAPTSTTSCRSATCVDVSAPRGNFTLSAGRRARRFPERRHRRHAGARDAARAGGRSVDRGKSGGSTAPATAASILLPRRRAPCSQPCPTATAISATARPIPRIGPVLDFDARGRLDMRVLQELVVPRDADFYICGPSAFMSDLTAGLAAWGVAARPHPHRDVRRRSVHDAGHRRFAAPAAAFAGRASRRGSRWSRSPGAASSVRWGPDIPEPARAGRGLRRAGAMVVPHGGLPHLRDRARGWERSATGPTRSMRRRTAMC